MKKIINFPAGGKIAKTGTVDVNGQTKMHSRVFIAHGNA